MVTRHRSTIPLLMAAAVAFLGACASPGEPGRDEIVVTGEDPVVIVHNLSYGPDMAVGGTLAYLPDSRCLAVDREGSTAQVTPMWPRGTRSIVHNGKRGVDVPSFGRILEGHTIDAGGDVWEPDDRRTRDLDLRNGCRAGDGFMVFNPDSFR